MGARKVAHLSGPPLFGKWATSATPFEWPREAEFVDHSRAGQGRRFLIRLVDFIHDGVEAAMAFDGVPIDISDGLPENRRICLGRCLASGCHGQENALGAVETVLVPSNPKYFDSPFCLLESVSKLPVGFPPAVERALGGQARTDVGEDSSATLYRDWHLDVEIPDASVGVAGVNAFRESIGVAAELLEADDVLLRRDPPFL